MRIALSIFLFEIALGGALFSFALRRDEQRPGAVVGGVFALVTVAAMSLLMNAWRAIAPFEKSLILAIGAGCGLAWSAVVARSMSGHPGRHGILRGGTLLFQLGLSAAAAWALSLFFVQKYPGWPERVLLPRPAIFFSIGGGLLCGAILMHAAMLGLNELAYWKKEEGDEGILRAGRFVCIGVALRAVFVLFSIVTGVVYMPLGMRAMIGSLRNETIATLLARVMLGLILPFMYGMLVQASVREHRRRQGAIQFIPIALLILFGEMLGAGITVGLWGLAL